MSENFEFSIIFGMTVAQMTVLQSEQQQAEFLTFQKCWVWHNTPIQYSLIDYGSKTVIGICCVNFHHFLAQTTVMRVLRDKRPEAKPLLTISYCYHLTYPDSGNTWFFLSVSKSWFLSPASPGLSAGNCSSAACRRCVLDLVLLFPVTFFLCEVVLQ